jgi:hypothetical protein
MICRNMRMALTVLVLGVSLAAAPAMAKNMCSPLKKGVKGCKNELKGCIFDDGVFLACNAKKGKAKRQCKHTVAVDCKASIITNGCKVDPTACTSSPSGAFLDDAAD